ncbi:protein kinase domain-containing protein [Leptothermofonsia sp. ETS-13]|uniref:protein kinase domain-containing protein n=1 Tax=Leptothermofonsia sp. ETS-13 TaxID=3035696 RepID=UPI003B9DE6FE
MRPPLPTGTVLQDRYRILSVLGQGGFGRTYLAEDQGRFNELCAMKELTPTDGGGYALEKSKELFLREGQTLYQIQHPQIPQFRATFEFEQRLFMVQDYVEGPTYRHLLDQRRSQGYTFSEAEVKTLMMQLLPVLAYIHSKGIIHRDITPDNIILRDRDHLPVLIDFGVVKELATRFQAPGTVFPGALDPSTTVGKVGYAPPEQMQTGRAYASSDLYSLAVTAVVLLTGREPPELFDDSTLTWYWQRWVSVSPGFVQVINRMLSYRPGDRYQSANEVIQALQSSVAPTPSQVSAQPYPPVYPPSAQAADVSRSATLAVGRRVDSESPTDSKRPAPVIEESRSSIWDDPLAVVAIGLGLVMLTGIASWAIVRSVLMPEQPAPIASVTPTQTATPSPSPSPSPTQSPQPRPPSEPITFTQRLDIAPNTRVIQNGTLKTNETINYVIRAQQGDQLSAMLSGDQVLMSILGPDRQPLSREAQRVSYWQGSLPFSSDYFIQIRPVSGSNQINYRLEVNLQRSPASPIPDPRPPFPSPDPPIPPDPGPRIDTERINFAPGDTGITITERANPNVIRRYLLNARRGQILKVQVNSGAVTLNIRYPDGRIVDDASNVLSWESELPSGGDYMIDVIAFQKTRFEMEVTVRDLVSGDGEPRLSRTRLNRPRFSYHPEGKRDVSYSFRYRQRRNWQQEDERKDFERPRHRHRQNLEQDSSSFQDERQVSERPRYRHRQNSEQEILRSERERNSSDRPRYHRRQNSEDSPQHPIEKEVSDRPRYRQRQNPEQGSSQPQSQGEAPERSPASDQPGTNSPSG